MNRYVVTERKNNNKKNRYVVIERKNNMENELLLKKGIAMTLGI